MGVFAQNKTKQNTQLNIKRSLLVTKTSHLKLMISVFFYLWEDTRAWAH